MNPEQIATKKEMSYPVKMAGAGTLIDVDMTKRIVTGLSNTALFFDSDYDVFLKGVNKKSIGERGPNSTAADKIIHLLNHQWLAEKQPGRIITLDEREVTFEGRKLWGTYFETKMSHSTFGNDILINYHEGLYNQHSEGFRYLDGEFIDEDAEDWGKMLDKVINPDDMRRAGFAFIWKEVEMRENSTVVFGANKLTPCLGVKSGDKLALSLKVQDRLTSLEKQLRSGKQSDDMMRMFEMEVLQLKQLIHELFHAEPSVKDTLLKEGRQAPDTSNKGVDFSQLLKNL